MACRVTPDEVKAIIDTNYTSAQVETFVDTANAVVNQHLATSGLSSAMLTQIELYLAAHFVAIADPREDFVWIGEARSRFGGKLGMHLDFTRYGQQVKFLDSSGILATLGKTAAKFAVISEED